MFEACYRADLDAPWQLDDQMCGNLCRCSGYRGVLAAVRDVVAGHPGIPVEQSHVDESPLLAALPASHAGEMGRGGADQRRLARPPLPQILDF